MFRYFFLPQSWLDFVKYLHMQFNEQCNVQFNKITSLQAVTELGSAVYRDSVEGLE